MAQYSVLLVYPEVQEACLPCTWFGSVEASSVDEAITAARGQCILDNAWQWADADEPEPYHCDDLGVLLVIAGEHQDLRYQAERVSITG